METKTAPAGAKNAFGADIGGVTYIKPPERGALGRSNFATFMILCPVSFFLGILFSQFPYDYPILWTAPTVQGAGDGWEAAVDALENHMNILYMSPPLISRMLHIVIGCGLLGFFVKLLRPTESNLLFDGASLALYVVGIVVYVTNIIKGMRMASSGHYATPDEIVIDDSHPFTPGFQGKGIGRSDSLRVLSASHTILALLLVGILVLQAGQWYAERKERQEIDEQDRKAAAGRPKSSSNSSAHGKEKKRA